MMSFENDHKKCEIRNPLAGFFFSFFAPACERIFIKTHSTGSRCDIEPKIDCLQGCPCTFSPEILQAGAVKRLTKDLHKYTYM